MRARDGLLKLFGLCVLAGVLVAGMLFPAAGSLGVVSNRAGDAVNSLTTDLVTKDPPLVTTVTDRDGKPIAFLYDQNRTPAAPEQIADTMKAAIVAIEDRRFFDHHGVDWTGTLRAAVTNQMAGGISQGGSTLTQQYVKNYLTHVAAADDPVKQAKAVEQTPARKLREIRIALQVEKHLTKEQILTRYLNVVPYGNQTYGVASAARTYFNTTPDKLTIAQAALLAGMVNSPSALNPETNPTDALNRRNVVIKAMEDQHRITPQAAEEARNSPLGLASPIQTPPNGCMGAGPADGFFCKYVLDYLERSGFTEEQLKTGGYTIRTSLDQHATDAAKASAEKQVPKTTDGIANVMTVVEPGKEKHRVRALVANRDFGVDASKGQTSYALPSGIVKFGAGSIYKVFTAAAALEKGMGIQNVLQVPPSYSSSVYKNGAGRPYTVGNAEGVKPGPRTLQMALATSPNTAFVALEERVGLNNVVDMAARLGMRQTLLHHTVTGEPVGPNDTSSIDQADFIKRRNVGAFTLGFAPTSPLELGNVAATVQSDGMWCPPTPIEQIQDRNGNPVSITEDPCEQAVDPQLAHGLAIGMSRDDQPGGTADEAASSSGWSRPVSSKTGTTEVYQSAGFLGATPQFAGAVLTFSDGNSPEGICDSSPPQLCGGGGNIYGGKVPARTWFNAMQTIHEGLPVVPLPDTTGRYENGGDEFQVPNVVGLNLAKAKESLQKAGYKVDTRSVNSQRDKGTVVSQTPRGFALPGETVTLSISTGYVPTPKPEAPAPGPGPEPAPGPAPAPAPAPAPEPAQPPGQQPGGPPGQSP